MPSNFHKPIQSIVSTKREVLTSKTVYSSGSTGVLWSKVDRTDLNAFATNYTTSFNIPFESDSFSSGSTLSTSYPELQQLNVNSFVIGAIDESNYNEMIDGRSITVSAPSGHLLVSSTYNTLQKSEDNILLGKNVAFLFCDALNKPYTGTTDGGSFSRSGVTSWSASSYFDRPAAVSYQNLQPMDINTDQRSWSSVSKSVNIPQTYPTNTNQGYNYDMPVGFVALDKGFIVLTHPALVTGITWTSGILPLQGSISNSGGSTDRVGFSGTSVFTSFHDVDVEYKTTVVVVALPGEFHFSNNPSWDFEANLQEYQLGSNNFDPTYVTEIGLYNRNDELIAIAKLDRPKEKGYTGVLTFSLGIEV